MPLWIREKVQEVLSSKNEKTSNLKARPLLVSNQPHFQRMIIEKKELSKKLEACQVFIEGDIFLNYLTLGEQILLKAQLTFMKGYYDILDQRIELTQRLS